MMTLVNSYFERRKAMFEEEYVELIEEEEEEDLELIDDDDEEIDEVTGGKKKKDKDKKYNGPKCLTCMKNGNMNVRTRKKSNGTWECSAGHKFKSAGNKPNFEQPIY